MACFEHGTIVELKTRENVMLPDMRGTIVRVTRGTVWITQEGDPTDVVLRTGDTWIVERDGLTIVEAQDDSIFCVVGRRVEALISGRQAALPSVWTRTRDALASFFATPTRNPAPYV